MNRAVEWRDSLDMDIASSNQAGQLNSILTKLAGALFYEGQGDIDQMLWYSQAAAANIVAWRDGLNLGGQERWVSESQWPWDRAALRSAMEKVLDADARHYDPPLVDALLACAETALMRIWERQHMSVDEYVDHVRGRDQDG